MTWLHRLFRRTPPHLRGRVPVDCGVGTKGNGYGLIDVADESLRAKVRAANDALTRQPKEPARHWYESLGVSVDRAAMRRAIGEAIQRHDGDSAEVVYLCAQSRYEVRVMKDGVNVATTLSELVPHMTDMEIRTDAMRHHMGLKPTPADNALRYTDEESTW